MKDNRTEPMKICDENKCQTCPIRNKECFGIIFNDLNLNKEVN